MPKRLAPALLFLALACSSGLGPPDDPVEAVRWAQERAARACVAAERQRAALPDAERAVCLVLQGQPFEVVVGEAIAPSGTGPDAGAATPALGGTASNGVRSVGFGGAATGADG